MNKKSWTKDDFQVAIQNVISIRQLLIQLDLKTTGGNYSQVKKFIKENQCDISHFTSEPWNKGLKKIITPNKIFFNLLTVGSSVQSYKLKRKLFQFGFKKQRCEKCGWAEKASDGRIPLELDHINGIHNDNRLENLQVLCPNCHSLQPTHRGKNIGKIKKNMA